MRVDFQYDNDSSTLERLANLLDADAERYAERQDNDITWENLRQVPVQQMLEKDLDVIAFYEFKKLTLKAVGYPNS